MKLYSETKNIVSSLIWATLQAHTLKLSGLGAFLKSNNYTIPIVVMYTNKDLLDYSDSLLNRKQETQERECSLITTQSSCSI